MVSHDHLFLAHYRDEHPLPKAMSSSAHCLIRKCYSKTYRVIEIPKNALIFFKGSELNEAIRKSVAILG
jgi:hypothetical protein